MGSFSGTDLAVLYSHGVGDVLICDGIQAGGVKGACSTESSCLRSSPWWTFFYNLDYRR